MDWSAFPIKSISRVVKRQIGKKYMQLARKGIYHEAQSYRDKGRRRGAEQTVIMTVRKHSYSNILKILQPIKETFQIKNSDIFHITARNIDCGYALEPPRLGGSNAYPQSIFVFVKYNV